MAKLTGSYEAIIVTSLKNGEEQAKSLVEKFSAMISENGTLESVNEWGKRRLAYPINYENDGYYAVYTFTAAPEFPAEQPCNGYYRRRSAFYHRKQIR